MRCSCALGLCAPRNAHSTLLISADARAMFTEAPAVLAKAGLDSEENLAYFAKFTIVVSDGINTTKLLKFARDGHSIDVYGIGWESAFFISMHPLACIHGCCL